MTSPEPIVSGTKGIHGERGLLLCVLPSAAAAGRRGQQRCRACLQGVNVGGVPREGVDAFGPRCIAVAQFMHDEPRADEAAGDGANAHVSQKSEQHRRH